MATRIFIDGEAGTTGLQIRARLAGRDDLAFIRLDDTRRKDERARREALNEADIVILCLPDEAAREAIGLIERRQVRVIDASSAHRTASGWVYGFPEMSGEQRQRISGAHRVTNPGCYPTGAVGLLRPLIAGGLLPADWPVTINAVSGYSGGGKPLIAAFENETSEHYTRDSFRLYALKLGHKHVEEMRVRAGLVNAPLFAPAVGRFYQGMLVEVPLQLWALPVSPTLEALRATLAAAYEGMRFVEVSSAEETGEIASLDPEGLNETNRLRLFVFGNEGAKQARLVALLDNLGKGASGQAVQNLNIMLGLDEATGLVS